MDYENQKMLEHMFNKHQILPLYKSYFSKKGVENEFALSLLAQIAIHRQANVVTMLGVLKHLNQGDVQITANLLEQAMNEGLINFDGERDMFSVRFDVDEKTKEIGRKYKYLPPMIVPPKILRSNTDNGHLTIDSKSLLLKDNHHDGDICLDSLNRFNQIPLKINVDVVRNIRNTWKNLDKQKDDEDLNDYLDRVKAFERYERDSYWILALMVEMGNQFWLDNAVDKRGRTYSQGYHINIQGNDWNKAVLEFHEEEIIEWQ